MGKSNVGSYISLLKTKNNWLDGEFSTVNVSVMFLKAIYISLNNSVHDLRVL